MSLSPPFTFLIVLLIGALAGLIFDRFAGPGWLKRQIARRRAEHAHQRSWWAWPGHSSAFISPGCSTSPRRSPWVGAVVGAAVILLGWRAAR